MATRPCIILNIIITLASIIEDADANAAYGGISSTSALFAKIKLSSGTDIHHLIEKITGKPPKIQNGVPYTYCISMFGKPIRMKKKILVVYW